MRNATLIFALLFVLSLSSGISYAQQPVSPEKLALIREYLQVTGGSKSAKEMTDMMFAFQETESAKTAAAMIEMDNKLSATDKAAAKKMTADISQRIMKRTREFFSKEIDLESMIEDILVPFYDKNFSTTELSELVAFNSTPTGQKANRLMPELMMASMIGFSEKLTPKLQEFFKRMAEEEYAVVRKELFDTAKKPAPKRKRS